MLIFPEVVVYEDINWGGAEWRTNLNHDYVGDFWNDKISSLIIISGTWQFWENAGNNKDGNGGAMTIAGPGYYSWVEAQPFNMQNDSISSFQVVSWDPQGDSPVFA